MTLILTALTRAAVVQASDRRLTRGDGRPLDGVNKTVFVGCADARFVIAYTGCARMPATARYTDEWLADQLDAVAAGKLTLAEISALIAEQAATSIAMLRNPDARRRARLTFVFAGFHHDRQVIIRITNMESANGRVQAVASESFSVFPSYPVPKRGATKPGYVLANGTEVALERSVSRRIGQKARKIYDQEGERAALELVSLIRSASRDPEHGRFIGRDCLSVVVHVEGQANSMYHPEKDSPISHAPHMIWPNMTIKHATFSSNAQVVFGPKSGAA